MIWNMFCVNMFLTRQSKEYENVYKFDSADIYYFSRLSLIKKKKMSTYATVFVFFSVKLLL